MITRIEVSGFKTLHNFALDFKPGLNILVGPNGSGKTNLVSFFEFLTNLVEVDASEATSRVGGAGAVFRRVAFDYERMIRVRLNGCVKADEPRPRSKKKRTNEYRFVAYEYGFELTFPESRTAVLFSKQSLKASLFSDFITTQPDADSWQLDIESHVGEEGDHRVTVKQVGDFLESPFVSSERDSPADELRSFEAYVAGGLAHNVSIISIINWFSSYFRCVSQDLSDGRVYNIIPSRVKLPEDGAKPPDIDRDGSGLSSTLYAIQRSRYTKHLGPRIGMNYRNRKHFSTTSLDQLLSFLKIVNSNISGINVYNDTFDNQLRVSFHIHSGEYRASVPLALMSDGTLKWIALVTVALTTRSVFSIEEPENFLHPQMQGKLIGILREILVRDDQHRMTLIVALHVNLDKMAELRKETSAA